MTIFPLFGGFHTQMLLHIPRNITQGKGCRHRNRTANHATLRTTLAPWWRVPVSSMLPGTQCGTCSRSIHFSPSFWEKTAVTAFYFHFLFVIKNFFFTKNIFLFWFSCKISFLFLVRVGELSSNTPSFPFILFRKTVPDSHVLPQYTIYTQTNLPIFYCLLCVWFWNVREWNISVLASRSTTQYRDRYQRRY